MVAGVGHVFHRGEYWLLIYESCGHDQYFTRTADGLYDLADVEAALGQQALPRVGHRWVKRATIAAVILLALCLFLVGLDCLVAGPAVIVGQAAIVTSAFLFQSWCKMLVIRACGR